jgi:hypothetical protein
VKSWALKFCSYASRGTPRDGLGAHYIRRRRNNYLRLFAFIVDQKGVVKEVPSSASHSTLGQGSESTSLLPQNQRAELLSPYGETLASLLSR